MGVNFFSDVLFFLGSFWAQQGQVGGQFLHPGHILLILVPQSGQQVQPLQSVLAVLVRVYMLGYDWWAGLWAGDWELIFKNVTKADGFVRL